MTIRFDHEGHRWEVKSIQRAKRWSTFDHATNFAELGDVLLPATRVESWLCDPDLLGQDFGKSLLKSVDNLLTHFDLTLPELHDCL